MNNYQVITAISTSELMNAFNQITSSYQHPMVNHQLVTSIHSPSFTAMVHHNLWSLAVACSVFTLCLQLGSFRHRGCPAVVRWLAMVRPWGGDDHWLIVSHWLWIPAGQAHKRLRKKMVDHVYSLANGWLSQLIMSSIMGDWLVNHDYLLPNGWSIWLVMGDCKGDPLLIVAHHGYLW